MTIRYTQTIDDSGYFVQLDPYLWFTMLRDENDNWYTEVELDYRSATSDDGFEGMPFTTDELRGFAKWVLETLPDHGHDEAPEYYETDYTEHLKRMRSGG